MVFPYFCFWVFFVSLLRKNNIILFHDLYTTAQACKAPPISQSDTNKTKSARLDGQIFSAPYRQIQRSQRLDACNTGAGENPENNGNQSCRPLDSLSHPRPQNLRSQHRWDSKKCNNDFVKRFAISHLETWSSTAFASCFLCQWCDNFAMQLMLTLFVFVHEVVCLCLKGIAKALLYTFARSCTELYSTATSLYTRDTARTFKSFLRPKVKQVVVVHGLLHGDMKSPKLAPTPLLL